LNILQRKTEKITLLVTPQRSVLNDLTNVVKNILVRFSSWLVSKVSNGKNWTVKIVVLIVHNPT
jgi:hypothetical protein